MNRSCSLAGRVKGGGGVTALSMRFSEPGDSHIIENAKYFERKASRPLPRIPSALVSSL